MIYIYSKTITSRLQYTCEVIFRDILQVDFQFVDLDFLRKSENVPIINYSNEKIEKGVNIIPHSLLFESEIKQQDIRVTWKNNIPCFFQTSQLSEIEHDIFSMSFYLISRYEEYLPFEADEHGRFSAKHSLAYKANFLQLPVVHLWAEVIKKEILKFNKNYIFPKKSFHQINTIDIDVAFAYKGKPFFRHLGGLTKSIFKFNFQELKNRFIFYLKGKDYLDTYSYIEQNISSSKIPTIFFFELGKYGTFDKNIPLKKTLKKLILRLKKSGKIGIHPSYSSNIQSKELTREIESLEKVLGEKVTFSRQHYLKLSFPETYENLITNNISEDYTMGFADVIGFRAGICVPYSFFNLATNESRPLKIIPFQIMDGTLKDYLNLTPKEAIKQTELLKKSVADVGGTFVSIFHNSSLTNIGEWKDWRCVFEKILAD